MLKKSLARRYFVVDHDIVRARTEHGSGDILLTDHWNEEVIDSSEISSYGMPLSYEETVERIQDSEEDSVDPHTVMGMLTPR